MIDNGATPRQLREFTKYVSQPKFMRSARVPGESIPHVVMFICKRSAVMALVFTAVWVAILGFITDTYSTPLGFVNQYLQLLAWVILFNMLIPILAQWFWPQTFPTYARHDTFVKICWRVNELTHGQIRDVCTHCLADAAYASTPDLREKRVQEFIDIITGIQTKGPANAAKI